ncbi:MAG: hypothetical protein U5R48_19670 [Gammaproteobacteria bacterium]|nr:hypothetical protein [Gammaproteobacteria bacterium]
MDLVHRDHRHDAAIGRATGYVSGRSGAEGASRSPSTALGLFRGMEAAVDSVLGRSGMDGLRVAIQGTGHVGAALADRLANAGARLLLSDAVPARVEKVAQRTGGRILEIDAILAAPRRTSSHLRPRRKPSIPETVERLYLADCSPAPPTTSWRATPDAGEQLARRADHADVLRHLLLDAARRAVRCAARAAGPGRRPHPPSGRGHRRDYPQRPRGGLPTGSAAGPGGPGTTPGRSSTGALRDRGWRDGRTRARTRSRGRAARPFRCRTRRQGEGPAPGGGRTASPARTLSHA